MLALHATELPGFFQHLPVNAPSRRRWLQEEVLSLISCYPTDEPVLNISKRLGRSLTAIYGKARRLGLSRPRHQTPALVAKGVLSAQAEMALVAPALDLMPPTPANPPFLPPVEVPPAAVPKQPKPFLLTPLGGRLTVWTPELVHRLILLWVAGFHHTIIAEVLDLTPCGVSSKAVRISLPFRSGVVLSKDAAAARILDAAGGAVPEFLPTRSGGLARGKPCNVTGRWFYGERGIHTCVEAKLTLHYSRMQQVVF